VLEAGRRDGRPKPLPRGRRCEFRNGSLQFRRKWCEITTVEQQGQAREGPQELIGTLAPPREDKPGL
jgi:hypothetical protein